ncbi:hypothetical protein RUND412_006012 [Rhizina undulata]
MRFMTSLPRLQPRLSPFKYASTSTRQLPALHHVRLHSSQPSEALRKIMRRVPHPVVIVTTSSSSKPTQTQQPQNWRGITLSSFNCFSLHPTPLISFNVRLPSSFNAALEASNSFVVHILSSSPRSSFLASRFAQLPPSGDVRRRGNGNPDIQEAFTHLAHPIATSDDIPLLDKRDSVTARLSCTGVFSRVIGDHMFWIGEVQSVDRLYEGFSLLYSDGHFWDLGRTITPAAGVEERDFEVSVDDGSVEEE